MPVKRYVLALLPGSLFAVAAGVALLIPAVRDGARPVVPIAIYAIAAAGVLVGLRFRNVRAVTALVMLALADQVVMRWVPSGGAALSARPATTAVALLLPLNFAALAWTPERRVAWRWTKVWTVLLVVEIVLVALLLVPPDARPAVVAWRTVFDPVSRYWATLGLPLVVPVAGAFVLAFVRFMLRPRPLDAGLVWALMISWLALGLGGAHLVVRLFLATGGLIVLVALIETSYALAYTDDLTGLPTRRALDDLLSAQGPEYVVAMVDIDHFKKFNDRYGHQSGDDLLRKIGTTLMSVRGGGRPFRYGGEEFAVVFPGTVVDEAIPHLEALRDAVAATTFTVRAPDRPRKKPRRPKPLSGPRRQVAVTVSIGVADASAAGEGPADVIRAADSALYRAKRDGRNRLAS